MYNEQGQWMLKEPANPLHGWLPADLSRHSDQALADQHGMMYRFLEQLLGTFHNRLRTGRVTMELLNMVVKDLSGHLEGGRFARVEVRGCEGG